MKEYLIDLYPKKGGSPSKTRLFSPNQASAIKTAKQQNPGAIKEL